MDVEVCAKRLCTPLVRIFGGLALSRISVRALLFCGDYEELLTAIQGGVVESCNVDSKRACAAQASGSDSLDFGFSEHL